MASTSAPHRIFHDGISFASHFLDIGIKVARGTYIEKEGSGKTLVQDMKKKDATDYYTDSTSNNENSRKSRIKSTESLTRLPVVHNTSSEEENIENTNDGADKKIKNRQTGLTKKHRTTSGDSETPSTSSNRDGSDTTSTCSGTPTTNFRRIRNEGPRIPGLGMTASNVNCYSSNLTKSPSVSGGSPISRDELAAGRRSDLKNTEGMISFRSLPRLIGFFAHLLFRYMTTWTLILLFVCGNFDFYYLRYFGKALRNTAVHTAVVSFYFCWVKPASITVEGFKLTGPLLRIFDIFAHHLPMLFFLQFYYSGKVELTEDCGKDLSSSAADNKADLHDCNILLSLSDIQSVSSWANIFYYISYRMTLTKLMKVSVYKLYLVNLNWLYVSYFIVMIMMDLIVDPIIFSDSNAFAAPELKFIESFTGKSDGSENSSHLNPWYLKFAFIFLSAGTFYTLSKIIDRKLVGRSLEEGVKQE